MDLGVAADRKTHASIRCVPLLGVSLEAAQELHHRAVRQKSEWLIEPDYILILL